VRDRFIEILTPHTVRVEVSNNLYSHIAKVQGEKSIPAVAIIENVLLWVLGIPHANKNLPVALGHGALACETW
jgi:hypothetical protein